MRGGFVLNYLSLEEVERRFIRPIVLNYLSLEEGCAEVVLRVARKFLGASVIYYLGLEESCAELHGVSWDYHFKLFGTRVELFWELHGVSWGYRFKLFGPREGCEKGCTEFLRSTVLNYLGLEKVVRRFAQSFLGLPF